MILGNETHTKTDDRSNTASKFNDQQNQNFEKRQADGQADRKKQEPGVNPSKLNKKDQKDDTDEGESQKYPSTPATDPKEFKKEDPVYNDKNVRG